MARTLLLIIPVGVIVRIGVVYFVTTVIFAVMSRTGGRSRRRSCSRA